MATGTIQKPLAADVDALNSNLNKHLLPASGNVNIISYTNDNYIAPTDGYVFLFNASNTGYVYIGENVSIGGADGRFSAFIRKGTSLRIYGTVSTARFVPLS